jgi:hypothetical protein
MRYEEIKNEKADIHIAVCGMMTHTFREIEERAASKALSLFFNFFLFREIEERAASKALLRRY